jgi:hypothetical protein
VGFRGNLTQSKHAYKFTIPESLALLIPLQLKEIQTDP